MRIRVNKYKNRVCYYDGKRFASMKERDRYIDLMLLQSAGEITDLTCQKTYVLISPCKGVHRGIKYIADFVYYNKANELIIEDTKGKITDVYRIKKILFYEKYKIKITEI